MNSIDIDKRAMTIVTLKLTSGTQTIKHRWAQGLVGLANGAGGGNATLENGSFDDDDDGADKIQ